MRTRQILKITRLCTCLLFGALVFSSCAKKKDNLPSPNTEEGENGRLQGARITGFSWTKQTGFVEDWQGCSYVNENTGFIVGKQGEMIKTTNGLTYTFLNTGTKRNLLSCYFLSATTGFIAGEAKTLQKTTDGGITWSFPSLPPLAPSAELRALYFFNANVGFLAAKGSNAYILKTVDGGNTWNLTGSLGTTTNKINSVFFVDANNGYAAGNNGYVFKTTNGGSSWTSSQIAVSGLTLTGVCFSNSNVGIVTSSAGNSSIDSLTTVYRTVDAGNTWTAMPMPLKYCVTTDVKFFDSNTGYIIGGSQNGNTGVIFRTNDAGLNWITETIPATSRLLQMSLTKNAPNERLFAIGPNGTILKGE